MINFDLNSQFEDKEHFLKHLSLHLIYQHGARQSRLERHSRQVDNHHIAITTLNEDYPSFRFKLAEDSQHVYSLYIQFSLDFSPLKLDLNYLALLMQTHFSRLHLKEVELKLSELAHRDDVTNLFNQRRLYKDLDEAIALYQDQKIPFSLLFIDIDHFKSVNDGHGHLVGSNLLVQVGNTIKNQVREIDQVYRYGGDEFVVLLPGCLGMEAEKIGHRLLAAIKNTSFKVENSSDKQLSVSIGVSDFPGSSQTKEDIIRFADNMMYTAKKNGRGKVVFAN